MIARNIVLFCLVTANLTLMPARAATAARQGATAPGIYREWSGEISDGASKKTLVRFKQERRSAFGAFGGGYEELFTRTARQIGEDIAGLVNAF